MTRFAKPDPKKAKANFTKHGVRFEECRSVLENDDNAITVSDFESDPDEERLITIGMSERARLLVVVYTYRNQEVRIISGRKASNEEEREYSEQ